MSRGGAAPFLLVIGLACGAGSALPGTTDIESRIAGRVDHEAALATVRDLTALGPRMGGTASGDRAAELLAGRMKGLGLAVEVIMDPPRRVHEESSWIVSLGDRPLSSAWPYGFSPSLSRVAALLALEEEAGVPEAAVSLKGAVVLTGRDARQAWVRAAAAGAIALLTDAPRDPNRYIDWAPIRELGRRGGPDPTIPVFGLSYNDGLRLRDAVTRSLREGTARPGVTVALESAIHEGRPRTVAGTLPGAGAAASRLILVCAHGDSDSGGPGADDNASGEATVLEIARALSRAAAEGILPESRPTITFVVWGSEIHSSRAWAIARPDDMRRLDAVINFDQTGTGAERDAVYYEGHDIPFNEPLLRILEAVADDHAGRDGFPPVYTSVPAAGGTDAYMFLPRKHHGLGLTDREIPSTTVFTAAWDKPATYPVAPGWRSKGWPEPGDILVDYSAYYHSSGDIPANTTEREPDNMTRCARLVAAAIYRLMTAPPRTGADGQGH